MKRNNKSGFTLLEIIIVVIIIGILASLALPRLFSTVENSRVSEAFNNMAVLRQSVERCRLQRGSLTGCDTVANLDIDDPNIVTNRLFNYTVTLDAAVTGYTIEATRGAHGNTTVDPTVDGALLDLIIDSNGSATRCAPAGAKQVGAYDPAKVGACP